MKGAKRKRLGGEFRPVASNVACFVASAMEGERPVALITGCSTGFGRAIVPRLVAKGCHVVATARNPGDVADLAGEHVTTLQLDVTDEASMAKAVKDVETQFGRIDILLNNAGYGTTLPLEETTEADWRRMYDVNVFGLVRLTQLVLPGMRHRGTGRIVNVASIAGHVAPPMMAAYCSSKFAVRALSMSLHGELAPHGLHVSLIEPGHFATNFDARSISEKAARDTKKSPYAGLHQRWAMLRGQDGGKKNLNPVLRAMVHASTARRPRFHYFCGLDAKVLNLGKRLTPDGVLLRAFRFVFRPANS